jgi:hypothetical protein
MNETKKLGYDTFLGDPAPVPGEYLVGIGKRGILSVSLIRSVRKVNHRVVRDYQQYQMEIAPMPHLKEFTEFERTEHSANVWVRGEQARPFFWHPRGKK